MTSSFSLPGGGYALFRAESVIMLSRHEVNNEETARGGQAPLRWVPMCHGESAEFLTATPPSRRPAYEGQIIAVAAPPASAIS